ncbi:MAG: glutamine--fructose-6-phosphate transaminase (isomerizing) [Magnetococcus sp. DMHC-6]
MCGIIGVIGERNATPILLEGLKRLEYRGYDSAGVAVGFQGHVNTCRARGKLVYLEERLQQTPVLGYVGIGHTRWATHGPPTEENAHPHNSLNVFVVHNGIIENHQELRAQLMAQGVVFKSETDTEVIPFLIEQQLTLGADPILAVRLAIGQLKGAFALGILFRGEDDLLIAVRRGSPLILGLGEGENFIASDATPLVPYTRRMIYLHDDDVAVLRKNSVVLTDLSGREVKRTEKYSHVSADLTEKWPYRHFMLKEIFEQPSVVGETLKGILHSVNRTVALESLVTELALSQVQAVYIVACGTSWHAGMVARYWLESLAQIPVSVDIASEFRYREPPLLPNSLLIVISQSGETADTLAALRYAKLAGQKVLGIINVPESSIARESDAVMYTQAGPEIGVASTKAFTTQLIALACFSLALAKARSLLEPQIEVDYVGQLLSLPALMEQVLVLDEAILTLARSLQYAKGFLFFGRGSCFPIALEGALKLKEISYIHAEGYAAGEMKHGPIALIEKDLPVVVLAPRDFLFEKVMSNMEEARARGGRLVVLTPVLEENSIVDRDQIAMVACSSFVAPILYVLPLQLLAYHIAVLKGTDVDQPRNRSPK